MTKAQFTDLVQRYDAHRPKSVNGRPPLPSATHCAVGLLILGKGVTPMVAAATLQISKSSALRILHYFVDFVVAKLGVIEMPTASERDVIRRKFRELASRHPLSSPDPLIPAFIGAIDGSHLPIRVPIGRHADFINYKGYTSFNMQAVVSPDYRFLHVSCGAPGRLSDGQHYRHTDFEAQVPDGWMLPTSRQP